MKNRLIGAGLLAGGIALTGLTGSAYAAGATPAAKDPGTGKVTGAAKDHGPVAITCVGTGTALKGTSGKPTLSVEEPGKLPALRKPGKRPVTIIGGKTGENAQGHRAPPAGAKVLKLRALNDRAATAKFKALPKGVHCFPVKPGIPGGPPPVPAR